MSFKIISSYKPSVDQKKSIVKLVENINQGIFSQVLMGVTGSGKTFTIANTIEALNKPTLVISHNKTLAAQLYNELCIFFPNNIVEYFVSYYDYYQPEAYLPSSNIYIEKSLAINHKLEKFRFSTVASLLSTRRDVIVVASVSCIYGLSNPEFFKKNSHLFQVGCRLSRNDILKYFVDMLYIRDNRVFTYGRFRVIGDTIDLFVVYSEYAYRFVFWEDELESIYTIDPSSGRIIKTIKEALIFPANFFVINKELLNSVIIKIKQDLRIQLDFFNKSGKIEEARRLQERTELDLEMIQELSYCTGIENYSRYIDGRLNGERPFCLLDYFPKDYLMIIDESHVTIPQFRAMSGGDKARKINLVEYGFRLPSAMDNRPLNFNEFEKLIHQVIFVSATPADYELNKSNGVVIEQIIRPTGLLDPEVEVRPTLNQIYDILEEIQKVVKKRERILIITLTKRMAEELTDYLVHTINIRCRYIHSGIKTLDRITILNELRNGAFDVLVGVNLLKEGLDFPEVSLIIILDSDKEGFLRNSRSLIQTIGRVSRHIKGRVIMYADRITSSMKQAIEETNRRRDLQIAYNKQHNITPTPIYKKQNIRTDLVKKLVYSSHKIFYENTLKIKAYNNTFYNNQDIIQKNIKILENKMFQAAKRLQFLEADSIKDTIESLKKQINS